MKHAYENIKRFGSAAGAVLLAASMLCGCKKAEEPSSGKKHKKHSSTTTTTTTTSEPTSSTDPEPTTNASTSGASYSIEAKLWNGMIPDQYEYNQDMFIDEEDECFYTFYGTPDHPDFDYLKVSIYTEDADAFRSKYQYFVPMDEYANGTLPTVNIGGYEFVTFTAWNFGLEIDLEETHYLYRHEAAGMTVELTVQDAAYSGTAQVQDILDNMTFTLPDLGLSDPEFSFESGEYQATVQELPMGPYQVTPSQAHFSEHVYVSSSGGYVTFSATATHVCASEKYLYTCDRGTVYIYLIGDDEMTRVAEIQAGFEVVTASLLDGDIATFYPDPDPMLSDRFFIVETVNGQDRTMSCLNDVVVSPDGQHILYYNPRADELHMLSLDPVTKKVSSEPFELEIPLEVYDLQYVFMADTNMYIRFYSYENDEDTFRLLKYDFDGNYLGDFTDETLEQMYTYAFYEFGDKILLVDQGEDTIRLLDKDGNLIDSVLIGDLIGIPSGNFTHYSLVQVGDKGDFILVYAYNNGGILEDLVFHIHIA